MQNKSKMEGIQVGSLWFAVLFCVSLAAVDDVCQNDNSIDMASQGTSNRCKIDPECFNACDLDELTVAQTGLGDCGEVGSEAAATSPTVTFASDTVSIHSILFVNH